ncbi:claudin-10-like [Paramormyrops kingsleyae]|uniref:claudin-10-like n=1 Tax=Paramormyrops kingsleyae TaxID=1676925 RepID=UPI003B975733
MSSMGMEILAFIISVSGWILISSTLPTDYWKVSSIDGTVITTATFWSNLWKTCVTDSTGISNCKDFPSMLALDAYIQVCRGLMISSVCLGFFGSIFALVGMKCTKIGGADGSKAKLAFLAGVSFVLTGLCSLTACSLYAHRITSEFFDPMFLAQKFELGVALFIGWAGSVLSIIGGAIFCFSLAGTFKTSRAEYSYSGATSFGTSQTKGVSKHPNPSKTPSDYRATSRQFGKNVYV